MPSIGVNLFSLSRCVFLEGNYGRCCSRRVTCRRSNEPLAEKEVILQATAQILTSSVNVAALSSKQKTFTSQRYKSDDAKVAEKDKKLPARRATEGRINSKHSAFCLSVCLSVCLWKLFTWTDGHHLALNSRWKILYSSANINISFSSSYITKYPNKKQTDTHTHAHVRTGARAHTQTHTHTQRLLGEEKMRFP